MAYEKDEASLPFTKCKCERDTECLRRRRGGDKMGTKEKKEMRKSKERKSSNNNTAPGRQDDGVCRLASK
jgi:hypothetical protein